MDELRELRQARKIPAKDIVEAMQQRFPGFDKTLLSKCEHGDRYGVQLRRDVMDDLIRELAPEQLPAVKKRRDGNHKLTHRIACRLETGDYEALKELIALDGYETMQDWLTAIVRGRIERRME